MKKLLLNQNAKMLSKNEQKKIKGGTTVACRWYCAATDDYFTAYGACFRKCPTIPCDQVC